MGWEAQRLVPDDCLNRGLLENLRRFNVYWRWLTSVVQQKLRIANHSIVYRFDSFLIIFADTLTIPQITIQALKSKGRPETRAGLN